MSNHCYIIAEVGVNHDGSLDKALRLIDIAKEAGADAVKFQTFTSKRLVTKSAQQAEYQRVNDPRSSQFDMLHALELQHSDYNKLMLRCEEIGMDFLSSPFDEQSLDLLLQLGVKSIKVPSGEITNIFLLRRIARANRPVILSTGMSNLGEVESALRVLGNRNPVSLLHCTTSYPTAASDVNLKAMLTLKNAFNLPIGYSDHTQGVEVSIAAVALGATIVEKHLTYDRQAIGPDHKASLEGHEFKGMVQAIRNVELALGCSVKQCLPSELNNRDSARKSLVFARDMSAGTVITGDDLAAKRPYNGISPMDADKIIGLRVADPVKEDDPVSWNQLQGGIFHE